MNPACRRLILALAVVLAAGCSTATPPPPPPVDAVPVVRTPAETTINSRFSAGPVTGRNWNCAKCYS
jgi:hypothetical protein